MKNVVLAFVVQVALCSSAVAADPVEAHWRWNYANSSGIYNFSSTQNWVDGSGSSVRVPSQSDDIVVFDAESATAEPRVIGLGSSQSTVPKILDAGEVSGNVTIRSAGRSSNYTQERSYSLVDPSAFCGTWIGGDVWPRWILPAIQYGAPVMQNVHVGQRPTIEVQAESAAVGSLSGTGGLRKDGAGSLVVRGLADGCLPWFWNAQGLLSFDCDASFGQYVQAGTSTSIGVESGHSVTVADFAVRDGSTLVKEGGGDLVVSSIGPTTLSVTVNGGSVSLGCGSYDTTAPADNAALWLDADDADSFEEVDSKMKWKDRRWKAGAAGYAIEGEEEGVGSPERREDATSGRSYVDFGWGWKAAENPSGVQNLKSNAAYMTLNPNIAPLEAFVVVRMKREQGGNNRHTQTDVLTPSFFGCSQNYYTRLGSKSLVATYGIGTALAALWQVDGVPYRADESYPSDQTDFHVVNVSLGSNVATINMLARDQTGDSTVHIGGMEIAEEILYSRRLTVDERNQTVAYLLKKWRNEDLPSATPLASIPELVYSSGVDPVLDVGGDVVVEKMTLPADTTSFTKEGCGRATVSNVAATVVNYSVGEGALKAVVATGPARAAAFHVDASDGDHMTMFDAATGKVGTWYDADGNGVHATASPLGNESTTNYPTLKTSSGDDGLLAGSKYVDFENYALMRWNLPNGGGKYWNNPADGKEIHLVIAVEGESCALGNGGNNGLNTPPQAVPVFCETGNQMFREDTNGTSYNYSPMADAYCLVDGDDTNYTWRRNAWPTGRRDSNFHVITVVMNSSAKFGLSNFGAMWGASRQQYKGHIRLAEMIVYNTTTNLMEEAQAVHARLVRKWCGFAPQSLSVAEGASLEIEPKTKTAVTALNSGSSIDVGDLSGVSSIVAHFDENGNMEPIHVEQGISFAGIVTVRVEFDNPRKVNAGTYDLIVAEGDVDFGESSFVVDISAGDGSQRGVKVLKTGSGLALSVSKAGFMMIVR